MTQTVLILGANGKIGSHTAAAFWNAGWTVRHYDRSTDMTQAAMGADVIVNGLNPPAYHDWENTIPAITQQVIAAAKASGATVIIPGNVYNFGAAGGELSEDTPQAPTTRKGRVRVEMEATYRASGVRTIILRAGSFIDPNRNGDAMAMMLLRDPRKARVGAMGAPDIIHAYCYLPDWARAAVALAERRDTLVAFADIPFPGHAFSVAEFKAVLEQATGRSYKISPFPWWLMTVLSPLWELARELREMRYLWDMSHWIGSEKFTRLLPDFRPTDTRTVMLSGLPADIHPDKAVRASGQSVAAQ
ncbi:MAG: epimerase [Thalassobium sp.]|uniref:sugar nucleotide-binding protein n=1 Tax=Octadecabacter sp. SW4 TaxID=2602067 RepID=UPI000C1176AD|nr:sugar nucleotide-binding protein [Octadecabacter sp. SW4]PHQ86927.1 MAG: epimerase [Thalassobium sp.]QEE34291.1 sugar nucleotide-binding protein [Octadecabacter sp. SW4]